MATSLNRFFLWQLLPVGPLPEGGQNVTVAVIQHFGEWPQWGMAPNRSYRPEAAREISSRLDAELRLSNMPSYDWICHSCNRSNVAHAEICSRCGFSALASGEHIKKARESRVAYDHPNVQDCKAQSKLTAPQLPPEIQVIVGAIALGGMVGLMYWSIVYPYPNGKPLDITDFIFLWWRELIIVACIAILPIICTAAWCIRLVRRWLGVAGN